MNERYLRTKEKYRIDLRESHCDLLIQQFDTFGPGVYWHRREEMNWINNTRPKVFYEGWLTREEITILKLTIPEIRFLKLIIDK